MVAHLAALKMGPRRGLLFQDQRILLMIQALEAYRLEPFRSSFSFHWVDGGKCDLGVIRPFCYDTDWISPPR